MMRHQWTFRLLEDEVMKLRQNFGQIEATSYPRRNEQCENLKTRIPEEHFYSLSKERMKISNELEISQPNLFELMMLIYWKEAYTL